jgi:excisionase family DNA binding protein
MNNVSQINMSDDSLLTPKQAAEMLGLHPETLRQYAADGLIKAKKTVGGHRRYQLKEVQQFNVNNIYLSHRSQDKCNSLSENLTPENTSCKPLLDRRQESLIWQLSFGAGIGISLLLAAIYFVIVSLITTNLIYLALTGLMIAIGATTLRVTVSAMNRIASKNYNNGLASGSVIFLGFALFIGLGMIIPVIISGKDWLLLLGISWCLVSFFIGLAYLVRTATLRIGLSD